MAPAGRTCKPHSPAALHLPPAAARRFHAIMAQQDQLFAADHDHQQHIEQQYALAQDDLYSWDTEVQAVLEGAAHAASRPSPDPPGGDAGFGEAPPDGSPSAAGNGAASAAAAVPSRRPNLEHVSAASVGDARSTTTTGSDVEGVVQIVRPEGELAAVLAAGHRTRKLCQLLQMGHPIAGQQVRPAQLVCCAMGCRSYASCLPARLASPPASQTISRCAASSCAPPPSPRKTLRSCWSTRGCSTVRGGGWEDNKLGRWWWWVMLMGDVGGLLGWSWAWGASCEDTGCCVPAGWCCWAGCCCLGALLPPDAGAVGAPAVAMASDPRMAKSHLPPSKLEPPAARGIGRSRRCRNYSIMRLPMVGPGLLGRGRRIGWPGSLPMACVHACMRACGVNMCVRVCVCVCVCR